MKRYIGNKKGSTLVLLVVAVGVISLLGTSILGVTMMNYRIKKANTQIKEAFYLSESGLDQTYAKAYEYVQNAVEESNELAKEFIAEFKLDNIGFLTSNNPYNLCVITTPILDENNVQIGVSYSFDKQKIQKQAELIFNNKFKALIDNEISNLSSTDNPIINVATLGWNFDDVNKLYKYLELNINSKYTNEGIQKTTSVKLKIDVPVYKEPYTVITKVIPINPFCTKVLTASELNVSGNSEFNGNVYVSGDLNINESRVTSTFNGELAVDGNINLEGDDSTLKVRDVYTKNIYLEGSGTIFETVDSGNRVYVKDDLEINNSNQSVNIVGSYYGFSDGTNSTTGPDNSSGININEYTGLNITITEDLYLYGTSYVNINDTLKYQTGESLSIKGNYRAYMQPLYLETAVASDGKDLRNVEFEEYDYMRLADHFFDGSDLTAMHKAAYIKYYDEEYGDLTIPININLNVNKIHTIGSTIDGGSLQEATISIGDYDKFIEAENSYNIQINQLGYEIDNEGNALGNIYFSDEIKLENIPDDSENSGTAAKYIYLDDSTGTYTLPSGNYTGVIITNKDILISNNVNFSGLIITSGKLTVSGNINFEGAVIAGGKVTLSSLGNKIFKYNKDIVSNIIAEYDLHKSIFNESTSIDSSTVTTITVDEDASNETVNVDYGRLLKFENWKME